MNNWKTTPFKLLTCAKIFKSFILFFVFDNGGIMLVNMNMNAIKIANETQALTIITSKRLV